jgi:hypothetical protein
VRVAAAEPAADPLSSTVTAVVATTVPVQFAAIGRFVSAQYVRSGKTVKDIDPVAEPWPLTVQLELEENVPLKVEFEYATSAPKLPSIFESCVTWSYETVPWIWRFESVALALPRLVAIPPAEAFDDALHPNLAAQLSLIPNPPLPTAEMRMDRAHAGNVPVQVSFHPPVYCDNCVTDLLPACQNELVPEIETFAVALPFIAMRSQLVRHPTKSCDPAQDA